MSSAFYDRHQFYNDDENYFDPEKNFQSSLDFFTGLAETIRKDDGKRVVFRYIGADPDEKSRYEKGAEYYVVRLLDGKRTVAHVHACVYPMHADHFCDEKEYECIGTVDNYYEDRLGYASAENILRKPSISFEEAKQIALKRIDNPILSLKETKENLLSRTMSNIGEAKDALYEIRINKKTAGQDGPSN